MEGIRINKFLSEAGVCSRRQADLMVSEGRVTLDGRLPEAGERVMPGQKVLVDGKEVKKEEININNLPVFLQQMKGKLDSILCIGTDSIYRKFL